MAAYTSLNHAEINELAETFAIGNVHAFKILSGGSENTNYLLSTDTNKYVLTICEQKSEVERTSTSSAIRSRKSFCNSS